MSLLGEGAAHPNAPLEMTKEAFPFLLLPHGTEVADGKKFPGAEHEGERETERERCGVMRRRGERDHRHDYRRKRKVGP